MKTIASLILLAMLSACGGGGSSAPAPVAAAPAAPAPVAPEVPAGPPPLQVYLFMGQSNMVGALGRLEELPPSLQATQQAQAFVGGQWVQYRAGEALIPVQAGGCITPSCFGPEVSFAAVKGAIGIVKFAVNGTGLAKDWMPTLLSQAIGTAQAAAAARPVHFAGAFWMQGETDSETAQAASAYAANLRTLVSRLRADLNAPDLSFTVCRINPPASSPWLFRDTVRAAQESPGITNYKMVDCDGLPLGPDRLHFTTAGLVAMGNLFASVTP